MGFITKALISRYLCPNTTLMKIRSLGILLIASLCCSVVCAQKGQPKKSSLFSYGVSISDYGFAKKLQDSTFGYALKPKDYFKSGNPSFGILVSYWKGLSARLDVSANLGGSFSNFPAGYIKDDSVGQAKFSAQLEALFHMKALPDNVHINPFLTAGAGLGYFGNQLAVYAPVGTGLQFRLNEGGYVFVQAQWRLKLNSSINNDFTFYSIGFAQQGKLSRSEKNKKAKKEKEKKDIPAKENVKKEVNTADKDTDGDGVPDAIDKCPTEKGNVTGCPDSDGDGIPDKDDKCKDVGGVYRYDGCPIPDTDGDGLNDEIDKCPTETGSRENHGCPKADIDGDGVPDSDDKCPTVAGKAENNGCPIKVADDGELINVSTDSMTYRVNFDFDRAELLSDAFKILRQVVEILKADNSLAVDITGHADSFGTDAANMQVSADRAKIVKEYFRSYNIAANRISSSYYGATRPFDKLQPWRNRRVEITLIKK